MRFTKMQGLGNDYLYVWADSLPEDAAALSVRLSDRHFGPGADGMIWILPSERADFRMRIFNADGSEAKMCGNGIRCVGKYVYDKGLTDKTALCIETGAGLRRLWLRTEDGRVRSVRVDMGTARVTDRPDGSVLVDVGNPHLVRFVADAETAPLETEGAELSASVPDGINVEFVSCPGPERLRMRVWERGSGITMACGTGACASAAAAVRRGLCPSGRPITVCLDGGELEVTVDAEGRVRMEGPAEIVYEGEIAL